MPPGRDQMLYKEAKKKLIECISMIRQNTPRLKFDHNLCGNVDVRVGRLDGKPVDRLVVTLRTCGCEWGNIGGGCTICGHFAGMSLDNSVITEEIVNQFHNAIKSVKDIDSFPIICVYNGGSFLNPHEIPFEAQYQICDAINKLNSIRKVVFESKIEYCSESVLRGIKSRLPDKEVVIATGLETVDDGIRDLLVNKGITFERFKARAALIKRFCSLRVYLLLGIPLLTDMEAIDDAERSVKTVYELGAEEIHIEPLTIQKHTMTYYLWCLGLYNPPWLWSIVELIRRVQPIPIYISPFMHYPRPVRIPVNCPNCTSEVRKIILEKYNRSYSAGEFDNITCGCYERFTEDLKISDDRSLERRLLDATTRTIEFLNSSKSIQAELMAMHERQIMPSGN